MTVLSSVMWVKLTERAASMMPPAMARPKESPKEPAAEFTPAASLTRSSVDGRERVVVELGDEQAEAAAGDDQRDDEVPPAVDAGDERDDEGDPDAGQQRSRRG